MSAMQIEFTDRYGGNPPSWLTACHGECEAMGYVPIYMDTALPTPREGEARAISEANPRYVALWMAAEAKEHADDGYHFVRCLECGGTGRVPLSRSFARIPRWLYKGARFMFYANKHCPGPASMSRWQNTVLAFKCAFLADLGLWRP